MMSPDVPSSENHTLTTAEDSQPVSHLQRMNPERFMRVNENGIYEFDRVIKRGKVLYKKRNKKV